MSTPVATVADALIAFIMSLLRDPAAVEEFDAAPKAVLASNGLAGRLRRRRPGRQAGHRRQPGRDREARAAAAAAPPPPARDAGRGHQGDHATSSTSSRPSTPARRSSTSRRTRTSGPTAATSRRSSTRRPWWLRVTRPSPPAMTRRSSTPRSTSPSATSRSATARANGSFNNTGVLPPTADPTLTADDEAAASDTAADRRRRRRGAVDAALEREPGGRRGGARRGADVEAVPRTGRASRRPTRWPRT